LPDANASCSIWDAQAFAPAGVLNQVQQQFSILIDGASAAQKFLQFFVSLNGSASGRSNGGTKFRARKRAESGRTMRGIESI